MSEQIEYANMNDISTNELFLEGIDKEREKFQTYFYNGIPVPRVSEILSETSSKQFLINWAAKLGYHDYKTAQNKALQIGSAVHEILEAYMKSGEIIDLSFKLPAEYIVYVNKAVNNFINWKKDFESKGNYIYRLATEMKFSTPFYGGTIDLIAEINGAVYIIDYKTSKQLSYEYILQTCAYRWAMNNGYCGWVGDELAPAKGIGLIRIDKEKDSYESYFLTDPNLLNQYTNCFMNRLRSFYLNIGAKYAFREDKKIFDYSRLEG